MEAFVDEAALVITLRTGEQLVARVAGDEHAARARLVSIQSQLAGEQYVLVGDEIVVRADEVRSIELAHDPASLPFAASTEGWQATSRDVPSYVASEPYQSNWGTRRGHGAAVLYRARALVRGSAGAAPLTVTSELVVAVLGIFGVLIAALVTDDLDAQGAWLIVGVILSAYILGSGIAKAGTGASRPDGRYHDSA